MAKNEPLVSAQVILRSPAAAAAPGAIRAKNIAAYLPDKGEADQACAAFGQLGFKTGSLVGTSFSITAPAILFEKVFSVEISQSGKGVTASGHNGVEKTVLPLHVLPGHLAALVQDIVLPVPPGFGPGSY